MDYANNILSIISGPETVNRAVGLLFFVVGG